MNNLSNQSIDQLRENARTVVRELGLLNDAYFEIGVTLAERHLLIELATHSSPTMKEIAERLLIDKSTASRLIAKAVKKRLIESLTSHNDKRKRFLRLTEKGMQTLHAFEPIAFNQTKKALSTLTPKERESVYQGIALYAQGLKNARLTASTTLAKITEQLVSLNCTLQLFKPKDKESLHKIFQEVVDTGSQFPYESNSVEEFERQFFKSCGEVYVCHTTNGETIGCFYLRSNYPGRSKHIANAAYMLRKDYRGKGIGTLLIQASLHLAKGHNFHAMQFNMVLSKNTHAVKLYEKLGFRIIGTIPEAVRNPDGSYQDGYVMHRKLNDL